MYKTHQPNLCHLSVHRPCICSCVIFCFRKQRLSSSHSSQQSHRLQNRFLSSPGRHEMQDANSSFSVIILANRRIRVHLSCVFDGRRQGLLNCSSERSRSIQSDGGVFGRLICERFVRSEGSSSRQSNVAAFQTNQLTTTETCSQFALTFEASPRLPSCHLYIVLFL